MNRDFPANSRIDVRGMIGRLGMTFCLASLLTMGLAYPAVAAGGDVVWQASDILPGKQEAKASVVDSQGNVIIAGFQNLAVGTNDDYWTAKFRADGSGVAWRASLDMAGGSDQTTAVAVDTNNDVIVTGYVWNGLNKDIRTVKYNGSSGAVVWQHTFDGANHGNDVGTTVAVDSLNNVYVGGYTQNAAGSDDYLILKFGPDGPQTNGTPTWQAIYNGPANGIDQVASLAVSNGGVAVTGQSWNGSAFDILTIKYDLAGSKLWERRYSAGGTKSSAGKMVRIDGAGNVIVSGSSANGIDLDIYTATYNSANGNVIWERTFNGAYDDEPTGLVLDLAGDVYITGYTWTLSGTNDFFTARYSSTTGDPVWQKVYDSGNGNTDEAVATGIVVDPAGDLFVTGYTVTSGNYDIKTIKYKRDNGNQLWVASFYGAANRNDRPVGISLSPAGEVLVAGWSDSGATDLDCVAIKYDAGGLNAPTGLTATSLSNTSIQLTWADNSANEDGFALERKLGELGSYAQIATVGPGVTSFTDTGLVTNNYYYYRVRAYNSANGYSHFSNEAHSLTVVVNFVQPSWGYLYNNPDNNDDFANGIAVGPDNNPVVTGYSLRTVGGFDYFTVKLNRGDKSVVWSDQYDDPDSEMDIAKCLTVDAGNNVIVSGYASLYFDPAKRNINSIYTIKYPAAGPPEAWHAQYNGPGAIDDRATAIATTSDAVNNLVVIGYGKNAANNDDVYVVKYNADGTYAWAATPFDGPGHGDDIPSAVAFGPDGSVYVAGYSERSPNSNSYYLYSAKYNGATGSVIWSDVYSVVNGGDNQGHSLAVDTTGDLYVTGYATNATGNRDIYTIKYNGASATPQRLWERPFDGAVHGDDEGATVRVDPIDGAIVVAGTTLTNPGDHDITIIRYSPAGDLLWQKTLQRPGNDDHAVAMTLDSSGYIYAAGNTSNGATMDIVSLIYDFEGTFLGAMLYNGAANDNDEASAIAANYQGEAFIAGYSTNGSGNADYVVAKQTNSYILVPAPFVATAQADFSKITLTWGNNTPGTSFQIDRTLGPITAGSIWTPIDTLAPGTTSYQDSGLNQNTQYCYRIEAFSGSLFSRKITTCTTTTLAAPSLNPVMILSVTAIDVTWNNLSGNIGYKLERMPAGGAWNQVGGTLAANTTIYHDTGLTAGTVYYYRVSALSGSGTSLPSSAQQAPVLNAPSGMTATKIDLNWPAVSGITGYLLERSLDNVAWSQVATPAAAATSYSDTGLASGTLYYYRLKAVTAAGASGPSLAQSAMTKLNTPAMSTATAASTTQVNLTWTDPNGGTSVNESGVTVEYAYCTYDNPTDCGNVLNTDAYWSSWTAATYGTDITAATIGSLTPGRSYRFRVTATLTGANSDPSGKLIATPNLVGPTNLSGAATGSTTIRLTWSDVLGETNYKVEQNGILLGVTLSRNTSQYDVTGLTSGTNYCYRVQPYNATSSAFSNQTCVTPLGPPSLNSVTAVSQTEIDLSWTDVPGIANYEIWRATPVNQYNPGGSWNNYALLTSPAAGTTSYPNTGLSAGYTYKYKMRYKLTDGTYSAYSAELQATTVPSMPANFVANGISPTQVTLSWTDGTGETAYNIQSKQRATASCTTEDWTGISSTPVPANYTSFTVTVTAGVTNCFRMNASNTAGPSPWTAILTKLPPPTLDPLSGVTQSQVSLSWNNVAANTGFQVERSMNGSSWATATTTAANVTTYTNTGLNANQIYYFRIRTMNGIDPSGPSNVQSATTQAVPSPVLSPPSSITISQMTICWNDVPNNGGYKVERSLDGNNWSVIANPAQGTTCYPNGSLSAGTLYYYRVSTKNSQGSFSAPSNVQSATTTPATPLVSLAVLSEARIDLTWQVVLGASNYKILRSVGPAGPWDQVANPAIAFSTLYCGLYSLPSIGCPTLIPAYTTYSDTGLAEDTQYCYQLKAWNATGGDSTLSNMVCAKTPAVGAPNLTVVTALNSMRIKIDWTYNQQACTPTPCGMPDGFQVWRQSWNGEWMLMATVSSVTTYTDTIAIEPQKAYSYQVRAYKGTDVSAFSNIKFVTTPAYAAGDNSCP